MQRLVARAEDLDLQRVAARGIARMGLAAVAARTGRQRADEIDLGEEFDEIARTHRARLHEIAMGLALEAGAHEHVEHVMDMRLRLATG